MFRPEIKVVDCTVRDGRLNMVTGILNQHPRSAMAHMESDKKNDVTDFYRQMTNLPDL